MSRDDWENEFNEKRSDEEGSSRPPRRNRDGEEWNEGAAAKQGMGTGFKIFLILLAVVGVGCLACCGGCIFFAASFAPKQSTDAAQVDATRDEIASIHLPAGFTAKQMMKMDNFFMAMRLVEYENATVHGHLMMIEMAVKMKGSPQDEAQMRRQMNLPNVDEHEQLDGAKTEVKKIKIKGKEFSFNFTAGEEAVTKTKRRVVEGTFDGKNGSVFLHLALDDGAYKEDEIIKMLSEIH